MTACFLKQMAGAMEFDAGLPIRFFCISPGDAGCLHSPYGQRDYFCHLPVGEDDQIHFGI